jgi:hypothetical protein
MAGAIIDHGTLIAEGSSGQLKASIGGTARPRRVLGSRGPSALSMPAGSE